MEKEKQGEFESQFNTAVAQIMRLNDLISRAHAECLSGNIKSYRDVLNRIWMELRTYCTPEKTTKRERILKEYLEICKHKNIEYQPYMGLPKWEIMKKERSKDMIPKMYKKMTEYEDFLREVMRELGFLGVKKEDMNKINF